MRKSLLIFSLVVILGVFSCCFWQRTLQNNECKKALLFKYKWIDPKDEKSLIGKMGFAKTTIVPSIQENTNTIINILNFSKKSNEDLGINNEKTPVYYFSETYISSPVYLYTIKDVSIFFGKDTRRSLIFKNGFYTSMGCEHDLIEKEDFFTWEKSGDINFAKNLTELPAIKNKIVFFHGDWNLYHIIMEASPGLLLINANDYKITLAYSSRSNIDIVKELGNPYVIPTKLFTFGKFSELVIPSPILENYANLPNIELMNKLFKKLKTNFSKKTSIKSLGEKIYVSRADASRRKVLNETVLIKHLKKRGFKVVTPGKYSVADQSKLFEDAEIIIGPHGLGLINMIFSNNLKTVIELFSTSHYPNCYLRTAQIKGVKNYYGIFHDADNNSVDWSSDYSVNIPEILKVLDTWSG